MRDRIERFVLLPFSMGCVSESSIAIGGRFPNRRKQNANSIPSNVEGTRGNDREEEEENEDDDESLLEENLKSTLSILAVPRFQRLFKNFKNLSQLFVYKDEEMEEEDLGMEIGLPTDVKHVTHIGIDGSATSILSKGWDVLQAPDLSALPSLHLPPFEFAMPAQADKINVTGTNQDELSALPSVHLRPFEFAMTAQADELNVSGTNQDEFGAGNKYERPVRKKE